MSGVQGDKYEAILDAAYALFGTTGFYETKMSDIADHAGIAKGTVYLYFKSKEELYTAVTQRDCEHFLHKLKAGLEHCPDIYGKLTCIADHHLRYYYGCKDRTKLFFVAPNNNPELNAYLKKFMHDYVNIVVNVLKEVRDHNCELYAQTYIGMLDRLKMDILYRPDFNEDDLEQRIHFASDLFIHGFMATAQHE